ncbi:MAG: tRNA pseudouridine(55) synthase TruB [Candidatus Margulisiibacteriota bacterium]
MDGIIIVDKPQEWTSFDVVAKIRNLSRVKKVGHSGTLDPMATGVLPIFLGKATKSIQYFMEGDKGYIGEMVLGVKTDSGDATGKTVMTNDEMARQARHLSHPERDRGIRMPNEEEIKEVINKYVGEIEQTPPMYSAVKVNGQRLYKLARKGIEIERKPRKITIHEFRLTHYDAQDAIAPRITFYVKCSKGTYIRQLVVDIGDDLGCGAHLSKLQRVYAHPFHISAALSMDAIITLAKIDKLATVVIPVEDVLGEQRKV